MARADTLRDMTSRALGALGRFFITTGVVLLLFAAFQLWGTGIQEARAQDSLETEFEEVLEASDDVEEAVQEILDAVPDHSIDPVAAAEPIPASAFDPEVLRYFFPDGGEPIARLGIPAIGVDKIVVEGVNVEDLRQGPGHYQSTPSACQAGNVAIAGHRTTYGQPFHNIDQLRVGDEISLEGRLGACTYRVIAPEKQNYDTGEYCREFEADRTERLSSGINVGAFTEGFVELDLPDDFAIGATDDITYFDTSDQQVGDAAPVAPAVTDEPGWFVVDPRSTCVIENYGDNRITLTACHPKYTARQRIVVQAELIGSPVKTPNIARPEAQTDSLASEFDEPSQPLTTSEPATTETTTPGTATSATAPDTTSPATATTEPVEVDASISFASDETLDGGLGWSWEFLPAALLWGFITLILWTATRMLAARWRALPTYVLSAMPLIVCLYFAFEKVDKVLPAY